MFRKYPPVQNERIEEFETYIRYADKYHTNFGGKRTLSKLISQVAPNWKYKRLEPFFFTLYKKYGMDSIDIEKKIIVWNQKLNKVLIDSFNIAFKRDQYNDRIGPTVTINDRKNAELLIWTFKNYGFPSRDKIGLYGSNEQLMYMGTLLNHMAGTVYYDYFKTKLLEYVKSGECTPRDYIEMVDKYNYIHHFDTAYRIFVHYNRPELNVSDSARINNNRKAIGFPTLSQSEKIIKDFQKKISH
ncbi:hypothetical protein [Chryseobacterium sp.]|uniref:hypothetical protein n=1 Tax=Chryseobacterium sp. TaxID=1871047 RepID=UPI0025BEAB6C|nr:hypothetical protein [Chryseobacterium sp.]MBV8326248.1 hypothetical protein [Chryseobacterium sp.]